MPSTRRSTRSTAASVRVAEKRDGDWHVNQWLKKAVLLSFRLNDMTPIPGGARAGPRWWDKVPSKFAGWSDEPLPRGRLPRRAGLRSCAAPPISRRAWC